MRTKEVEAITEMLQEVTLSMCIYIVCNINEYHAAAAGGGPPCDQGQLRVSGTVSKPIPISVSTSISISMHPYTSIHTQISATFHMSTRTYVHRWTSL